MMLLFNFMVITLAASLCVNAEAEDKLIYAPPFTDLLEDTLFATVVLKNDVKQSKPESAEFLKVYIAVKDLAEQVAEKGENAYPEFYTETVRNALKQVIDNPIDANSKLWEQVNNTHTELVKIISFVIYKQLTECAVRHASRFECDSIIVTEVTHDPDLKQRTDLLVAGGKQGKIFLDISNRLRNASKSGHLDAEEFLNTGSDVMKPLVLAAYKTQKIAESLKL